MLSPAGGGVTLQAGGSGTIKVTTSTPPASSLIVTLTAGNANVAKLGSPPAASHAVTLQASSTSMAEFGAGRRQRFIRRHDDHQRIDAWHSKHSCSKDQRDRERRCSAAEGGSISHQQHGCAVARIQQYQYLGSRGHSACDIFSRKVCRGPGAQRVWRTLALPTSVINPHLTPTPGSLTGASLSGTAPSVASRGTNVIRPCNNGIQTFTLAGTTLSSAGSKNTGLSATRTGADTVGTVAVRLYSGGIEVFNVATLSAPALFGSNLNDTQSSSAAS